MRDRMESGRRGKRVTRKEKQAFKYMSLPREPAHKRDSMSG